MPLLQRQVIDTRSGRRGAALALLAGAFLFLAAPARACIWDRDTLDVESRGLPDVARIITGRFERNPPLYYELRLKRVTLQVQRTPADPTLYDDAGAACDRLHRDGKAIDWMRRKAAAMNRYGATPDDRYRYHANLGTFMVHRWLRDGHDPKRIAEVDAARAEISRALAINPNSHLGRERQQLAVMGWLREICRADRPGFRKGPLGGYLVGETHANSKDRTKPDWDATIQGVAGLVALGDAWESRDIFDALVPLLCIRRRFTVAYLAEQRRDELRRAGRPALSELLFPTGEHSSSSMVNTLAAPNAVAVRRKFRELRREAEDWQRRRTEFMMARLTQGRHPDTDPHFWDGFSDRPPPGLAPNVWDWLQIRFFTFEYVALALILLVIGIFLIQKRRSATDPV